MEIRDIQGVREQIRRDAIMALAEDRYTDDDTNRALLAAILPDSAPAHWEPLWQELCERIDWRNAVEDGADIGYDDDGRPEDRQTVLEDVERDIAALVTKLATDPAPPRLLFTGMFCGADSVRSVA